MKKPFLKNPFFISVLGHITIFSIFSLSFGYRVPLNDFSRVYSWGSILSKNDLMPVFTLPGLSGKKSPGKEQIVSLNKSMRGHALELNDYFKPQVSISESEEKLFFTEKLPPASSVMNRKGQVITFHPHLPVDFLLFFKDRQAVHIELMFNIITTGTMNSVTIKRKISSGNLEADLLSMRYISHYLFLQHARFPSENWQSVKIDLSGKND